MPRLNSVDPAASEGRVREIFDGPLKGKHRNIFKGLANSPAVLDMYLAIGGAMSKSALTGAEKEIVQLAIGQANGCEYCCAAHTGLGKGFGLTDEQCLGARRGTIADHPKYDALTKFALALHEKRGSVSDADLQSFRTAGFDDGHVCEVIAVYATATLTNMFNHVNETVVDFPAAPAI